MNICKNVVKILSVLKTFFFVLHFKTPDGSNCLEKKPNPERVMNVFRHNVRFYCKLPVIWHVWGMWCGGCTRKTYRNQLESQNR
jgi:hypothetical protein